MTHIPVDDSSPTSGPTSRLWTAFRCTLRELFGITPTLDLHGLGVREAVAEVERFLRQVQACGEPVVRIVYGKGHGSPGGKGVLRDVIPSWLAREGVGLVERYERLPDATGADGAVRVWLRAPARGGAGA